MEAGPSGLTSALGTLTIGGLMDLISKSGHLKGDYVYVYAKNAWLGAGWV
jgi:hypothetical protein